MPVIDPTHRAVLTLAAADPQFRAFCDALYGPGRDAEAVYRDAYIAKSNPDAADVHVNRPVSSGGSRSQRWALRVGLAGVGAGALASGSELARGVGEATGRSLPHIRLVPTKVASAVTPARRGVLRASNAGFALTADTIAGSTVHQRQRQVTKAIGSRGVDEMAHGLLVQTRRATKAAMGHGVARSASGEIDQAGRAAAQSAPAIAEPATSRSGRAGAALGRGVQAAKANPVPTAAAAGALGVGMAVGAQRGRAAAATSGAGYAQPYYYSKSEKVDVEFAGRISKVDKSKRLAFGWANVCKVDGQLVNDKQADITMPEDLEDAVYGYNLHGRVGGDMHMRTDGVSVYPDTQQKPGDRPVHVSDLVESVMFTAEKKQAMGLPNDFPEGWWTGFRYTDTPEGEQAWQEVLAGQRPGFSIHGSGRRESVMV